jgi:hypothetical protein
MNIRKEKLKVERGYHQIIISKLSMQEYDEKFNGFYGAYSIDGGLLFHEQ